MIHVLAVERNVQKLWPASRPATEILKESLQSQRERAEAAGKILCHLKT